MLKAVIVAVGDLDNLPNEVQEVSNVLSSAGWTVRLCLGVSASRAGLLAVTREGNVDLVWMGLHSGPDGFQLGDGIMPPAQLGTWLRNVNAEECVLNACYSVEHVDAIQRAADDVGVACTISPAGVDDSLAWQWAVYAVQAYVQTGDMREAVRRASGAGSLQYRYIPAGGVNVEGQRRMPTDEIREQLAAILRLLEGETKWGQIGLVAKVNDMQTQLMRLTEEQRQWRSEQREWRDETERRLSMLEQVKPVLINERAAWIAGLVTVVIMVTMLTALVLLNWKIG